MIPIFGKEKRFVAAVQKLITHNWHEMQKKVNAMFNQLFAREWKCRVAAKNSETFIDYLYEVGVKAIALSPGFQGAQILRRKTGEKMEVTLITYWDQLASIDPFVGQNMSTCRVYPEDEVFEGPDLTVRHYEVLDYQFAPEISR